MKEEIFQGIETLAVIFACIFGVLFFGNWGGFLSFGVGTFLIMEFIRRKIYPKKKR